MQHLINKQTIHLYLTTRGADAFRMQQQMSEHYWRDVVPVMASLFDELSNGDEVIRIDQLEVDLGVLTEKDMNQTSWSDAILSTIRKNLVENIGVRVRSSAVIREAKIISLCGQWLFYMQHGYLPWNSTQVDVAWYGQVLETLAVDFVSIGELRRMIRTDQVVSRRIVLQHKEDFLVKLVEILTAQNQQNLPLLIEGLQKDFSQEIRAGSSANEIKERRQGIWVMLLQEAARTERQLNSQELTKKILIQQLPPLSNRSELTVKEEIFVRYAGLVVIHPFLSSLFKRLQLTKEGKFESKQAQLKALYILHYLATGRAEAEEYDLPVAKVLCAWPLGLPVEKGIELSADELKEADTMLEAAIEQWTVLKNTSAAGLREGFLQRNGKLFTQNNMLYLRVEAQSIDVLLDQLPWVLSMIKLPWMKELLRVEWR